MLSLSPSLLPQSSPISGERLQEPHRGGPGYSQVFLQSRPSVSTNRPVGANQDTLFFGKNFPLFAKSNSATPTPQRGKDWVSTPSSKGVQSRLGQRKGQRSKSLPRASCVRGLGGTKGRRGESPDGKVGAKPQGNALQPPLAETGSRASPARPRTWGPRTLSRPAVFPAPSPAGHLFPGSRKPTLLCKPKSQVW